MTNAKSNSLIELNNSSENHNANTAKSASMGIIITCNIVDLSSISNINTIIIKIANHGIRNTNQTMA
jgi:hypothetical protein